MHPLVAEIDRVLCRLGVIDCAVLVGVSGGADSIALLRGLLELKVSQRLSICAGHLNHGLRPDAAADAQWVQQFCDACGVPCAIGSTNVAVESQVAGVGIEEAAREARYTFLKQIAHDRNCRELLVAHTADDQAETVLHHIIRGTGLAGLRGMPATRTLDAKLRLVRPLLEVSRCDVLDYLGGLAQEYRTDETNADETFTRNRLRRSLIPKLEREYNPNLGGALCRLSRQAAEVQETVEACAAAALDRAIEQATPEECRLKWQGLARYPRHLVREALAELWRRQGWPRQAMTYAHWDRLAELLVFGGASDFPGGLHARRSGRLFIVRRLESRL